MPLQAPSIDDDQMNFERLLPVWTLKRRERRAPLIAAVPCRCERRISEHVGEYSVGCTSDVAAPETGALRRRVRREQGMLSTDLIIAMAILVVAVMPLAFSFAQEGKLFRQSYQKAAAMELIDGEMEVLVAGEWRNFHEGSSPYELHGSSTRNLPPGRTLLTINGKNIRLEWLPEKENAATKVVREGVGR
jgi:hypothetical protein